MSGPYVHRESTWLYDALQQLVASEGRHDERGNFHGLRLLGRASQLVPTAVRDGADVLLFATPEGGLIVGGVKPDGTTTYFRLDKDGSLKVLTESDNDYLVQTYDLGVARADALITPVMAGRNVTVARCTGTISLKIGLVTADPIPIDPLTWPQMVLIEQKYDALFLTNAAQPGRTVQLYLAGREL